MLASTGLQHSLQAMVSYSGNTVSSNRQTLLANVLLSGTGRVMGLALFGAQPGDSLSVHPAAVLDIRAQLAKVGPVMCQRAPPNSTARS